MFSKNSTLLIIVLFISFYSFSQTIIEAKFGEPTYQELSMTTFDKDPGASGVVLYEKGDYSIELVRNYVMLVKKVHIKTKVIDASKFEHGTVDINLYLGKDNREKVTKIKAVTHNGKLQTYVKDDAYFNINKGPYLEIKRFTFPNIKDGSILEYEYTVTSPFLFNLDSWAFQSDIPTIYSEFISSIPANYIYNRSLYGNHTLEVNEARVLENCFSIPAASKSANCEISHYIMKDIPAFKEEDFMLAKSNYIARVDFELMTYYDFDGLKHKYSKTWKDVDKEFKNDKDMGRQLNYSSYFEDKIPQDILTTLNELEKAKKTYTFIQNHYNWNGNYGLWGNSRVKKAFENKSGSITEINLTLINALKAAGLDAKIILHSTRNNGLPNAKYPVIKDFNYTMVYLTIGENHFILDASDKEVPFNMVPFRALNIQGRVMDFKNGSFWEPIIPFNKNINYLNAQLSIDEGDMISGTVTEAHTGYRAIDKRKELKKQSQNEYISKKELSLQETVISNYSNENKGDLNQPLKEKYHIDFNPEIAGDKIYLFPYFLQDQFKENPFTLNQRNYLVEIGYPRTNTYILSLDLKGLYDIEQLPTNKKIQFAGDSGVCTVIYAFKNGKLNVRFSFKLNHFRFSPEDYQDLKDFFKQVVEIQTNEPIVLKKL